VAVAAPGCPAVAGACAAVAAAAGVDDEPGGGGAGCAACDPEHALKTTAGIKPSHDSTQLVCILMAPRRF